jgi:hypothetical protein
VVGGFVDAELVVSEGGLEELAFGAPVPSPSWAPSSPTVILQRLTSSTAWVPSGCDRGVRVISHVSITRPDDVLVLRTVVTVFAPEKLPSARRATDPVREKAVGAELAGPARSRMTQRTRMMSG